MAYNTGFCNSFTEIKSALIGHCLSNGWSQTTDSSGKDVIYKGNLYLTLEILSYCFMITGRTSVNGGDSPKSVGIANFHASYLGPIQFPVKYFYFTYSDIDEVYFLINYADKYQWLAFGKSNITLPGTGLWIAGTAGLPFIYTSHIPEQITMSVTGGVSWKRDISPGLFWPNENRSSSTCDAFRNYWLHSNINPNYPWALALDNHDQYRPVGITYLTTHLQSQPNAFNQQSLLLPVLVYHTSQTYSGYYTLVAHIQKARHLMINYLDPETTIYHGSEQWMVFPYFRKVYQSPTTFDLSMVNHTGNFGWAIKKEA